MHKSTSRVWCPHRQDRLHEQPPSAFVADSSHPAALVTMGQLESGRILHQQNHGRGIRLVPALVQVRLQQGRKGHSWLSEQPIQRFGLVPALQLSGQRTQRIRCHAGGRLNRTSRATQIMQLDTPKGSLGPALGVQQFLCVHPAIVSLGKMWVRIRHSCRGGLSVSAATSPPHSIALHIPTLDYNVWCELA
jgi:hypothetical protein